MATTGTIGSSHTKSSHSPSVATVSTTKPTATMTPSTTRSSAVPMKRRASTPSYRRGSSRAMEGRGTGLVEEPGARGRSFVVLMARIWCDTASTTNPATNPANYELRTRNLSAISAAK